MRCITYNDGLIHTLNQLDTSCSSSSIGYGHREVQSVGMVAYRMVCTLYYPRVRCVGRPGVT